MQSYPKFILIAAGVAGLLGLAGTWKARQNQADAASTRPVVVKNAEIETESQGAADNSNTVPQFANEAERERTLPLRRAALPVFLKAAAENILQVRRELDSAKSRGVAKEIATLETRLITMERVRLEVLRRNSDIDARDFQY